MKINYVQMLTDILTKQGAFGELKMKFREVASRKPTKKQQTGKDSNSQ